jgi:hypothetical protein
MASLKYHRLESDLGLAADQDQSPKNVFAVQTELVEIYKYIDDEWSHSYYCLSLKEIFAEFKKIVLVQCAVRLSNIIYQSFSCRLILTSKEHEREINNLEFMLFKRRYVEINCLIIENFYVIWDNLESN